MKKALLILCAGLACCCLRTAPAFGEQISRPEAAAFFPGYTLRAYGSYHPQSEVYADYSRIEDGVLHVRRAMFPPDGRQPQVEDCLPVPLSGELLRRLESEGFDALLEAAPQSALFLTDAAFDTSKIPVTDRVLDSCLQTRSLILLTQDARGVRRLQIVTESGGRYAVARSPALPHDARLNLSSMGDGGLCLRWDDAHSLAYYRLSADGSWVLTWAQFFSAPAFDFENGFCGIWCSRARDDGRTIGLTVGTLAGANLLENGVDGLPRSVEALHASLHREGWAVVRASSATLHACPDRGAPSPGTLFCGTPVRVLKEAEQWCEVAVGMDDRLSGWVPREQLAFGHDMDQVKSAFPQKILREEYQGRPMYASPDTQSACLLEEGAWMVGTAGDGLYILLTSIGDTFFAPQAWFEEGHG